MGTGTPLGFPINHQPSTIPSLSAFICGSKCRSLSPQAKEVEHFAVELVAAEGLVGDVGAAAVEGTEAVAQVPERPAPAGFLVFLLQQSGIAATDDLPLRMRGKLHVGFFGVLGE